MHISPLLLSDNSLQVHVIYAVVSNLLYSSGDILALKYFTYIF